jgi:hypothetical protein
MKCINLVNDSECVQSLRLRRAAIGPENRVRGGSAALLRAPQVRLLDEPPAHAGFLDIDQQNFM